MPVIRAIAAFILIAVAPTGPTHGAPLANTADTRATGFVVDVTTRDLHDARNGNADPSAAFKSFPPGSNVDTTA